MCTQLRSSVLKGQANINSGLSVEFEPLASVIPVHTSYQWSWNEVSHVLTYYSVYQQNWSTGAYLIVNSCV